MSNPSSHAVPASAPAANVLERKLDELALLVRGDVELGQFLSEWLVVAVHAARADDAIVWLRTSDQRWTRVGLSIASADRQPQSETIESPPAGVLAALNNEHPSITRERDAGVTTCRGICRIRQGGQPVGALEAVWETDAFAAAQGTLVPFLGASAELAGDFLVQHELRHLRREHAQWRQWDQFLATAEALPSSSRLAHHLTHDGRTLTGSDRLTVVQRRRGRWTAISVSGVDLIDPRSTTVQALEHLAGATASQSTLILHTTDSPAPPEMLEACRRLQHASQAAAICAVPLPGVDRHIEGVVICESFEPVADLAAWEKRCGTLQRYAAAPWSAATEAETGVWSRWMRGVSRRVGRRRRLAVAAIIVGGLTAVLCLVPADLTVTAEGMLLPEARRDVFAATTGIVAELHVEHGADVVAGQTLIVLRDPALDLEATRIAGELSTVQTRLGVVQAARISASSMPGDAAVQAQQLAAEEEELKQKLDTLTRQQVLLEQERAACRIVSPLDGQVLTWDVAATLSGRPVERGQVLLTVGDLAGPWIVEAHVRERDLADLRQNGTQDAVGLAAEFKPSATLEQTYRGRIREVAQVADVNERGETTVRVTIEFDRDPSDTLRPGATVLPRIRCGQRSLGYVWLHDLVYALRRQWWLWW